MRTDGTTTLVFNRHFAVVAYHYSAVVGKVLWKDIPVWRVEDGGPAEPIGDDMTGIIFR
jgi:hypothetical protein